MKEQNKCKCYFCISADFAKKKLQELKKLDAMSKEELQEEIKSHRKIFNENPGYLQYIKSKTEILKKRAESIPKDKTNFSLNSLLDEIAQENEQIIKSRLEELKRDGF